MKAYINIPGDKSVGIFDENFEMEIPDLSVFDPKEREVMRKDIIKFYSEWCDSKAHVSFSDECDYCGKTGHDISQCPHTWEPGANDLL